MFPPCPCPQTEQGWQVTFDCSTFKYDNWGLLIPNMKAIIKQWGGLLAAQNCGEIDPHERITVTRNGEDRSLLKAAMAKAKSKVSPGRGEAAAIACLSVAQSRERARLHFWRGGSVVQWTCSFLRCWNVRHLNWCLRGRDPPRKLPVRDLATSFKQYRRQTTSTLNPTPTVTTNHRPNRLTPFLAAFLVPQEGPIKKLRVDVGWALWKTAEEAEETSMEFKLAGYNLVGEEVAGIDAGAGAWGRNARCWRGLGWLLSVLAQWVAACVIAAWQAMHASAIQPPTNGYFSFLIVSHPQARAMASAWRSTCRRPPRAVRRPPVRRPPRRTRSLTWRATGQVGAAGSCSLAPPGHLSRSMHDAGLAACVQAAAISHCGDSAIRRALLVTQNRLRANL